MDAHDARMDERSEARYSGPDDREREEAERYERTALTGEEESWTS